MYEKVRLNLFFWLLTEAVQVVALFTKELATSCESHPDFLTRRIYLQITILFYLYAGLTAIRK